MQSTNFTVDPCESGKWLEFSCARRVNGPDNINQLERLIKLAEKQTIGTPTTNCTLTFFNVVYLLAFLLLAYLISQ